MKKDSVRFTVCIHKELFERLDYVSQFYGCSNVELQKERKYGHRA